ncbi:MAG: MBL fold metallo-hydrolase [Ignavibacteria bacterium]|jgi:metallo-beta-lactamase family protein|nr:MBL fold metallo-hydrolase [Ignavibacteria bacterium]
MRIKFCGAAKTVTGSQHLIEIKGKKILLDCGIFQGKREESFQMNRKFIYNPGDIHCVILSHAHMDHSGNLPTLYSKGFRGTVYSTPATRDLCSIMLIDSAYIQQKDTEFVNKRRAKKNQPLFNPLYTIDDAKNALTQFKTVSYRKKFNINGLDNEVFATFYDAGHILGSSSIVLEYKENGAWHKLGFTGDLGRKNLPILKDPEFMGDVDYIITESTYGGLYHEPATEIEKNLIDTITEAVNSKGIIIVPSFSVGRTQELVYEISKLTSSGKLPEFPVYVDSPLSVNATEIFKLHPECFDRETYALISAGVDVFGLDCVKYIRNADESKRLNAIKNSAMIISASGMCEAGRILHHLANNIGNPKNTIMIIGYMAEHTLGRELIKASDKPGYKVKIFGEEHVVKAKIRVLNSFSAHADSEELLDYFKEFDKSMLKKIFLVHGESPQQDNFKGILESNGFKNIIIPERGQEFEFN